MDYIVCFFSCHGIVYRHYGSVVSPLVKNYLFTPSLNDVVFQLWYKKCIQWYTAKCLLFGLRDSMLRTLFIGRSLGLFIIYL